jgi:hypothetical protein
MNLSIKWLVAFLVGAALLGGVFYGYWSGGFGSDSAKIRSDVRQDAGENARQSGASLESQPGVEAPSRVKIDPGKLPPRYRELATEITRKGSFEDSINKMKLQERIKKADALIEKTERAIYGKKVPENFAVEENDPGSGEAAPKDLLKKRALEIRERLEKVKGKISRRETAEAKDGIGFSPIKE